MNNNFYNKLNVDLHDNFNLTPISVTNIVNENKNNNNKYRQLFEENELIKYFLEFAEDITAKSFSRLYDQLVNLEGKSAFAKHGTDIQFSQYLYIHYTTIISTASSLSGLEYNLVSFLNDSYQSESRKLSTPSEMEQLFFTHILDIAKRLYEKNTEYPPLILSIIDYIKNNIRTKITKSEICDHFNLSSSYISTVFLKHTNLSVRDFILKQKVRSSAETLVDTQLSIVDISILYTFSSQSNYIKYFKDEFGTTPAQYRIAYNAKTNDNKKEIVNLQLADR